MSDAELRRLLGDLADEREAAHPAPVAPLRAARAAERRLVAARRARRRGAALGAAGVALAMAATVSVWQARDDRVLVPVAAPTGGASADAVAGEGAAPPPATSAGPTPPGATPPAPTMPEAVVTTLGTQSATPTSAVPTAVPTPSIASSGAAPAQQAAVPLLLDVAGGGQGEWRAEGPVEGGTPYAMPGADISLAGVSGAAPLEVYRTCRFGPRFGYDLGGLRPGGAYLLRLHWAELDFEGAGERVFQVEVGGEVVVDALDVVAETGGRRRALVREIPVTADAEGTVAVVLSRDGPDNPFLSGLELLPLG